MPLEIDWSNIETELASGKASANSGGGGKGGKSQFLRIPEGSNAIVRFFGQTTKFLKVYIPKTKRSLTIAFQDKDAAAKMLAEHSGGDDIVPQTKYATRVFDRADGTVKVYEYPYSVFEYLGTWCNTTKINPCSNNGYDFRIEAKGDKPRKYIITPLTSKPFSADERKMIDDMKANNQLTPLKDIFKEVPLDKLIERAFGSGNYNSSGSGSPSEVTVDVSKASKVAAGELGW